MFAASDSCGEAAEHASANAACAPVPSQLYRLLLTAHHLLCFEETGLELRRWCGHLPAHTAPTAMNIHDYLNERFTFEIERRESLIGWWNSSVTILVLIGGGFITMVSSFQYGHAFATIAFWVIAAGELWYLLPALWYLLRSMIGYEYHFMPSTEEVVKHVAELEAYSAQYPSKTAEQLFDEYLCRLLSQAATANQESNQARSVCISYANKKLVRAAALCILISVPYLIARCGQKQEVHGVSIVNPIHVTSMSENDSTTQTGAGGESSGDSSAQTGPASQPSTPSPAPAVPQGPPTWVAIGNEGPRLPNRDSSTNQPLPPAGPPTQILTEGAKPPPAKK